MVGAVSSVPVYRAYRAFQAPQDPAQFRAGRETAVQGQASVWTARRAASPETPVQPVTPVRPVNGEDAQPARLGPVVREGADPAEIAVRMRIQPYPDNAGEQKSAEGNQKVGAEGAQAAIEEGKCQTCEKRKYQDGSDDMGVSFQTPTRVAPEQAAAAVRGHENEHVVREQAKAKREGREVVSQSVTMHTGICPECGRTYVSGGTTHTVTRAAPEKEDYAQQEREAQKPTLMEKMQLQ